MTRREFLLALTAAGASSTLIARADQQLTRRMDGRCDCGAPLTITHAFDLRCPVFGPVLRELAEDIAADLNRPNVLASVLA